MSGIVGVVSLGCAKNRVDSERMLGLLVKAGFTLTDTPSKADILIVNTCGFIEPAKQESINTILEMAQYKKQGRCRLLVVTGCLSERYRGELAEALPEADLLLGVREYDRLPTLLIEALRKQGEPFAAANKRIPTLCAEPRVLTTPPYSAYLRIGDGCSNRCAYCAIPLIRGPLVSEPMEKLWDEARALADAGVSELNVIAQDTSGYGKDLYGAPQLIPLLKGLDRIDALKRIRLLYTYPDTVTPELLDVIASSRAILPYLDLPLQHINDELLLRMHRRGNKAHILHLMDVLTANYQNFTLRTTFLVGFPGETDAQFRELMDFLVEHPFDRVGAFAYSAEEGTEAAKLPLQVDEAVKQERLEELMERQADVAAERNARFLGKPLTLLVEGWQDGMLYGRTEREAPDADGYVAIPHESLPAGSYLPFVLDERAQYWNA